MNSPTQGPPLLFTPGPTLVPEDVRAEMSRPAISHRSEEARRLFREVTGLCARVFDSSQRIFLSTSSATGLMEAAVRNCVRDRCLCLSAGAFGDRWADIVAGCGRTAVPLRQEWGRAIRPEAVAAALAREPVDAVTVIHNETSTGVAHPLAEIAAAVREVPEVMLLVDVVSSIGGMPVSVDALGTDVCLAGVQKALALPAGFAVCSVSDRALARAATIPGRGFYFDFERMRNAAERDQALTTPSIPHLYAMRRQLGRILEEGLEERCRRHRRMADRVRGWAGKRLALYAEPGFESDTVTCIRTPEGIDAVELVKELRNRGFILSAGYGKLRHRAFRIGHMGEHTFEDIDRLLAAADEVLDRLTGGSR